MVKATAAKSKHSSLPVCLIG